MANLEGNNIRRQYISKSLPPKLAPLTKDVPTPSKFLLSNNLNDRISTIETSQKMLQTYSKAPYYKNSKNLQRFSKNLGDQNKGYSSSSSSKPEITTTSKNNSRGINDHNTTRETELH